MKKITLVLSLLVILCSSLSAGIEDDIKAFAKENGENYISPFVYSMSANLNNGWYNSAETGLLHFGFTINTMFALIPDDAKTFMAISPDTMLFEEKRVETATCFGNEGGVFHSTNPEIDDLVLPRGGNLKFMPFAVPQAELGLPGGFGVQLRFVPKVRIKDFDGLSLIGIGVKNEISRQFPLLPFAVAFQASYQKFEIGDLASYTSLFANLHASKSLIVIPVTFFGGVGLENATFEADYTYDDPVTGDPQKIEFEIKNENEFRVNLGARFKIYVVDLIMEYSLGKYKSARAGFGFSL